MDNFVQEFLVEARDYLEQIDQDLLVLERDGASREILGRVFRNFHSIKGCAQFLGFANLGAVGHSGESLLSQLRDGHLAVTAEIVTAMLAITDATREMLEAIGLTGKDGDNDYADLIQKLHKLEKGMTGVFAKAESPKLAEAPEQAEATITPVPAEIAAPALAEKEPETASVTETPAAESPEKPEAVAVEPKKLPVGVASAAAAAVATGGATGESTIRVDVGLLDRLMTLVGELVLARNQILQYTNVGNQESQSLQNATQRLDSITTDLQEGMMKTRMQPIRNVWNAVPRVVRDLCQMTGKKVRVMMEGEQTELDKTVLEAIKDPITHMVRNAVDHGIELPEKRLSLGKPEEGVLLMRAWHEGGQVNIELIDDGQGIDPERVKRKAIERGILRADQAARMTDREAVGLIFKPGFSTAESLTMISGRGVGMDVVKSSIEAIGGNVDVESVLGQGSTMKLRIPLTLAILKALIIVACEERYAIPQINLVEIIRLEGEAASAHMELLQGVTVYRYRGRLLPMVNLNRALGMESGPACQIEPPPENGITNIVVLQADKTLFGLVVDKIVDPQEIVVRPLAKALRGIEPLAGATIMGDGQVALILDVFGLARQTHVLTDRMPQLAAESADNRSSGLRLAETIAGMEQVDDRRSLLVMKAMDGTNHAISLDQVRRLEAIAARDVEFQNGTGLCNYRGTILHLVDPVALLGAGLKPGAISMLGMAQSDGGPDGSHTIHVVVCREDDEPVGLMFAGVVDIVREHVRATGKPRLAGSECSAIVAGKLTDILDVPAVLELADRHLNSPVAMTMEARGL
ncbi:MAG: chemotaxis protein CheA [bacterium]